MTQESAVPESEIRDIIAATVLQFPGQLAFTVASQRVGLRLLEPVVGAALTPEIRLLLAKAITAKGEIAAVLPKGQSRLVFKKFPPEATAEVPSDVFHICRVAFIYLNMHFDELPASTFKRTWTLDNVRTATGKYDTLLTKYEEDMDRLGQAEVASQDLKDADKLLNVIINGLVGDEKHERLASEFDRMRAILAEFIPVAKTDLSHMTLQ